MERTRKHLLAAALALAAALILAVPALAADTSEDGYTIVSTANELMAELSKGTQKIRFGANIDMSNLSTPQTENLVIQSSLDLDLCEYTWTVTDFGSGEGSAAIYLIPENNSNASFTIQNGTITIKNRNDSYALWQEGGTLSLHRVNMNGGAYVSNVSEITNCNITRYSSDGAAALWVSENGTVGELESSTFEGKGSFARGIVLWTDASINSMYACTVTSDDNDIDEGCSIGNGGTIGRIVMESGSSIDGIIGGKISQGIIFVTGGEIGTITGCEISTGPDSTAAAAIQVESGTIGQIYNNTITAQQAYGILNKGTISALGENEIVSDFRRGGQPAHVLNDSGTLTVTAAGTIREVEFDFGNGAFMKNVFIANDGGWYVQNSGAGGTVTAPNATVEEDKALRFTGQIRLIEPWGLRVNVGIPNAAQSEIESVKVTFTQGDRTETVTAGYNADYSQAKVGVWYSADLTGIRTQYLNEDIEFTAVVTLADGTTIKTEETKTVNMVDVLESCAANGDYSSEERAVYEAILDWFTAYQAYLKAYLRS